MFAKEKRMGILKNIFNIISGKQTSHIFHDDGATWGLATSKSVKLKRLPDDATFALVYETLFNEGYDYVVTGKLIPNDEGLSVDALANQRMIQWQKGTNRLVGYSKITAGNGQPACCGWSGILKAEGAENRTLQLEYFGYSASGKELFINAYKKCPTTLSENMASVDYTDIVKEMNDLYAIVTSVRIL